jgi:hypothetical protein
MTNFPHTDVWNDLTWTNYHQSLDPRVVEDWVQLAFDPSGPPQMQQQGTALSAILQHCVTHEKRLALRGSSWSLSKAVSPEKILLDPGALNLTFRIPEGWLTGGYQAARGDKVPVFAGGGAKIGQINDDLGQLGLALQTSGAADGHRIAGCIGTATHGADIKVGAVHDTVKAVCLLVATDKMLVVQGTNGMLTADLGHWLEASTGIPTAVESDDELLRAAQVSLGGLGIVYAVVMETVPLYEFDGIEAKRPLWDGGIWQVMEQLDPTGVGGSADADVLACMLFPYAKNSDARGAVASVYQKKSRTRPYTAPTHSDAMIATDTSKIISAMSALSAGVFGPLVGHIITSVGQAQYDEPPKFPKFPGELFGPTSLPPGNGASTEIVFARQHAAEGTQRILEVLRNNARSPGRHHFGVCGVRFVAASRAHLAMNQSHGSTFVEVAGLKTNDSTAIQRAVWDGLRSAGIPFVCHWGQEHDMKRLEVDDYYGAGVAKWIQARNHLLGVGERKVFANELLSDLGLA